jgi:hypothetical protein
LAGGSLLCNGQTQVGEPKIGEHFLINNSDVEVIGSLLLVHCVLLPRADCLFISLSCFSLQTRKVRSIDSLSCANSEGHRPSIIGAPISFSDRYRRGTAARFGNVCSSGNRTLTLVCLCVSTYGQTVRGQHFEYQL